MKRLAKFAALAVASLAGIAAALPPAPCPGGTYEGTVTLQQCVRAVPVCDGNSLKNWELDLQACGYWCCPDGSGATSSCSTWDKGGCCYPWENSNPNPYQPFPTCMAVAN